MKYDIVYLCKEGKNNNELTYSIRSVVQNFPYNKIWIYGGCPTNIKPDEHRHYVQCGITKWANTNMLLKEACKNNDITENFWLFNDDFFVMHPVEQELPPLYDGALADRIIEIENRQNYVVTSYTRRLRELLSIIKSFGYGQPILNYAVHMPMLINRQKALDVMQMFPETQMFRGLYGNYYQLGGEMRKDTKYFKLVSHVDPEIQFISTTDLTFNGGEAGKYIKAQFPEPSKYEVIVKNE